MLFILEDISDALFFLLTSNNSVLLKKLIIGNFLNLF